MTDDDDIDTSSSRSRTSSAQQRHTSARKHSSLRTATSMAAAVNESTKPKDVTHYVKITKAALEFKMLCIQAEIKLLDELSKMSDEEKFDTLFFLLDKDQDGIVSAVELADGLRKTIRDIDFEESLVLAIDRVATFDKDGDAKLNLNEFQSYVTTLSESIGCTFHELSEMLIMQVVFAEGNTVVEDFIASVAEQDIADAVKSESEIRKAFNDKRMKALFDVFDIDHDGTIDFKEVVFGMYKITSDIDGASRAAVNALIMFDDNTDVTRSLNYETFCRFIINVVHVSSQFMTFDDIADAMTRAAASPDIIKMTPEELTHLFAMDSSVNRSVEQMTTNGHKKTTADQVANVQSSTKVDRLFKLWDNDHNGYLDSQELALGIRKFQETTSLVKTAEEVTKIMTTYDSNQDQKLDPKEFTLFIEEFIKTCGADHVNDMIDFMIVTSALKENSEQEKRYIQSMGSGIVGYWD